MANILCTHFDDISGEGMFYFPPLTFADGEITSDFIRAERQYGDIWKVLDTNVSGVESEQKIFLRFVPSCTIDGEVVHDNGHFRPCVYEPAKFTDLNEFCYKIYKITDGPSYWDPKTYTPVDVSSAEIDETNTVATVSLATGSYRLVRESLNYTAENASHVANINVGDSVVYCQPNLDITIEEDGVRKEYQLKVKHA